MQQSHQTLFCLHRAVQHVAAAAVVKLGVGKHLFHVGEKLLHRAVAPTGTLVLHRLEVHGVGDHVVVVLGLVSGHGLPEGPAEAVLHELVEDLLALLQLQALPPGAPLGLKHQLINLSIVYGWWLRPRPPGRKRLLTRSSAWPCCGRDDTLPAPDSLSRSHCHGSCAWQ